MSTLCVEVVLAQPDEAQRCELVIKAGTRAREAVLLAAKSGINFKRAGVSAETAALGVYSNRVDDDYVLVDGDRLEVYRPLQQDPMELRRRRAKLSTGR